MTHPIRLFGAFGVEIEYMIVDRETLGVRPVADELLRRAAALPGARADDDDAPGWPGTVEFEDITWSNELVLHVIEFKTTAPARSLSGVAGAFRAHAARANALLADMGCMLLPTGMHPLMDPLAETRVWPHGYSEVYETFNRIFDCRGHGWSNLQATHLNLPFHIDADEAGSEFGRLHAAVRALLPIMPALAASTPLIGGSLSGVLNNRMEVYRTNSARVPQATGMVIPERAYTRGAYEREVLEPIYRAYEPLDPEGVLRHEWANSRGAIARFSRETIEVRVLDVQECPVADVAVCGAVAAVSKALAEGATTSVAGLQALEVAPAYAVLLATIRDADRAVVSDEAYLRAIGWARGPATAGELWQGLLEAAASDRLVPAECEDALATILRHGCLSRRIRTALSGGRGREDIIGVYGELARCLGANRMFGA